MVSVVILVNQIKYPYFTDKILPEVPLSEARIEFQE